MPLFFPNFQTNFNGIPVYLPFQLYLFKAYSPIISLKINDTHNEHILNRKTTLAALRSNTTYHAMWK